MLAVFAVIAAPSKKGEKASPAKNRDADRSAEFRNGTISRSQSRPCARRLTLLMARRR